MQAQRAAEADHHRVHHGRLRGACCDTWSSKTYDCDAECKQQNATWIGKCVEVYPACTDGKEWTESAVCRCYPAEPKQDPGPVGTYCKCPFGGGAKMLWDNCKTCAPGDDCFQKDCAWTAADGGGTTLIFACIHNLDDGGPGGIGGTGGFLIRERRSTPSGDRIEQLRPLHLAPSVELHQADGQLLWTWLRDTDQIGQTFTLVGNGASGAIWAGGNETANRRDQGFLVRLSPSGAELSSVAMTPGPSLTQLGRRDPWTIIAGGNYEGEVVIDGTNVVGTGIFLLAVHETAP